jgi:hypothetical protein
MSDQADKAHKDKEAKTAAGERMVPHATFTDGDRELRAAADEAEVDRVEAFQDTGYIAAPGVGDYHAARRAAKLASGAGVEVEDPASLVIDQVKEAGAAARKDAAKLRRQGGETRSGEPSGRRSAPRSSTSAPAATADKPASQSGVSKTGDAKPSEK